MKQLTSRFELIDNFKLEGLIQEGRSRIEEYENFMSCIIRFPHRDHFLSDSKTDWLVIVASKSWILSVHKSHSNITCEIYKKISTHGYFALSLSPSTDILLYIFLDLITNECFYVSDLVHEKLQALSQVASAGFRRRPGESNRSLGVEIAKARGQALGLRQSIGPLREVVGKVARGEFAIVASYTLRRFEDLYDRTISLIEVIDTHREEIHDIGDILINVQTLTTNNIIRVLTIISAIFLPLTLIAGIYGTNFGHGFLVPGSNSELWVLRNDYFNALCRRGVDCCFQKKRVALS
jgi:magnesium transporter